MNELQQKAVRYTASSIAQSIQNIYYEFELLSALFNENDISNELNEARNSFREAYTDTVEICYRNAGLEIPKELKKLYLQQKSLRINK